MKAPAAQRQSPISPLSLHSLPPPQPSPTPEKSSPRRGAAVVALAVEAGAMAGLTSLAVHPAMGAGLAYAVGAATRGVMGGLPLPGLTAPQRVSVSAAVALLNCAGVAMLMSMATWPAWSVWSLVRVAVGFGWNAPLYRFLAHANRPAETG